MSQLPYSVIWFAITAFVAIAFGLHLAHIRTIGFVVYVDEVKRAFDIEKKEATKKANFIFWFDCFVVLIFGIVATSMAAITFHNIVNPTNLW